ncbi:hypothetical protein BJ508DRAFT_313818 [Ascobolus immersus RN42]|uniref:Uncharacterized protein n=1 Tax=Ascobolus immersus RN42 TaxID=1160509 RepID=A0A3N4HMT0_ASCIM|nr:hypothetical protein BJ508DRAFT_313818 [Ascobolus immersus RN42]
MAEPLADELSKIGYAQLPRLSLAESNSVHRSDEESPGSAQHTPFLDSSTADAAIGSDAVSEPTNPHSSQVTVALTCKFKCGLNPTRQIDARLLPLYERLINGPPEMEEGRALYDVRELEETHLQKTAADHSTNTIAHPVGVAELLRDQVHDFLRVLFECGACHKNLNDASQLFLGLFEEHLLFYVSTFEPYLIQHCLRSCSGRNVELLGAANLFIRLKEFLHFDGRFKPGLQGSDRYQRHPFRKRLEAGLVRDAQVQLIRSTLRRVREEVAVFLALFLDGGPTCLEDYHHRMFLVISMYQRTLKWFVSGSFRSARQELLILKYYLEEGDGNMEVVEGVLAANMKKLGAS